jgi:hypothetical protein
MAEYAVTVKEIHFRTVIVEADGPEDAQMAALTEDNWLEDVHVENSGMDKSDPLSWQVCDRDDLFRHVTQVPVEDIMNA